MKKKAKEENLREHKTNYVLMILKECGYNRTHAAEKLGVHQRTVVRMVAEMRARGIKVPDSQYNEARSKRK